MKIFIDGQYYEEKEAKIPILDHGFLYGNGVFTTITTFNGIPLFLDDHVGRLFESAGIIGIPVRWSREDVKEWTKNTYNINRPEIGEARIRINISRGAGPDINIEGNEKCVPSLSIIVSPLPNHSAKSYNDGIEMVTVNLERVFPKAKNFNFLPSIIALKEAKSKGFYDALLVDRDGYVTEATTGNLFFFKNNTLYTTSSRILEGVTMRHIVTTARKSGIRVIKKMFSLGELITADEAFLSGTTKIILPVKSVNKKQIGRDGNHVLTNKLKENFQQYILKAVSENGEND